MKKASFWDTAFGDWALLVMLMAIGVLWYFGILNFEKIHCDNPDECVCEEWDTLKCVEDDNCWKLEISKHCKQLRKLTQQELIEKSCKENPREDDDCKCVEKFEEYCYTSFTYVLFDSLQEITVKGKVVNENMCVPNVDKFQNLTDYTRITIYDECLESIPKTPKEKCKEDGLWACFYHNYSICFCLDTS